MDVQYVKTPLRGDKRGVLVAYQEGHHIPFSTRRVYFIFGSDPEVVRGRHAHKKLHQLIVCIQGQCELLLDDGKETSAIILADPCVGVVLPPHYWHELIHFAPNTVLAVFCDDIYDENDYLRSYEAFLQYHVQGIKV